MYPDNSSTQVMHCRCPKNSVAYLVKRQSYNTDTGMGYQFSFACSPQTVSHTKHILTDQTSNRKKEIFCKTVIVKPSHPPPWP